MLPHYLHRTNQGSICFILLPSLLLYLFIWTFWTMFSLSVRGGGGVNDDTLENEITLDFCLFNSRCVIKLWETLVGVILAPNLNIFTTYRSETLVLTQRRSYSHGIPPSETTLKNLVIRLTLGHKDHNQNFQPEVSNPN